MVVLDDWQTLSLIPYRTIIVMSFKKQGWFRWHGKGYFASFELNGQNTPPPLVSSQWRFMVRVASREGKGWKVPSQEKPNSRAHCSPFEASLRKKEVTREVFRWVYTKCKRVITFGRILKKSVSGERRHVHWQFLHSMMVLHPSGK